MDLQSHNEFLKMHNDAVFWQTALTFFLKDLNFAEELLEHTALFKGKTINEKRLAHLKKIEKLKVLISEFSTEINRHEEEMKNLVECDEISCDLAYQERHEQMENHFKMKANQLFSVKSEIMEWVAHHIS